MLKQLTRSTGTISFPPLSSLDHPRLPKVSFVRLELDLEIRGSNRESSGSGKGRETGSEGKERLGGEGEAERQRAHKV